MSFEKYLKEILSNTEINWATLEDIAVLKLGPMLTKKMIEKSPGSYPVYSSAIKNDGETGRINSYMYDGEYITWTTDGIHAGEVFYRNGKFNINSKCGIVIINSNVDINIKYLYYWLRIAIKDNMQEGSIFNYAYIPTVKETLIPLIPREIQDKLVSLLDPTQNCLKSLEEELKLRRQQYSYLHKKLFNLNSYLTSCNQNFKITWTTLEKIGELKRGNALSINTIEKLLGSYPVYSSATLNDGEIGRINSYMYDGEYVTWTATGEYAGTVFYRNGKFNITHLCGIILIKPEYVDINIKFLYYWLGIVLKGYVQIGARMNIASIHNIKDTPVPLIPREVQDKLVSFLDPIEECIKALEEEIKLRKRLYSYMHQELFDSNVWNG